MTTIYVDPTAKAGGNGSSTNPYNSWSSVHFSAGNTYLQKAGTTYNGTLTVSVQGTNTSPVTIGAYGTGAAPVVHGTVNFNKAAYTTFSGFTVTGSTSAGMTIQSGTHNVTISGDTVTGNKGIGIWIGGAAGGGNVIQNSTITLNGSDGIAINDVGSSTAESYITGNNISTNGQHGIELDGNYFTVSGNTTDGNGTATSGCSGIHLYASSTRDGYGNYNVITGNVSVGNHDTSALDGNGIELDQWTHNNQVTDNFCYDNDGAGIVLYDASKNVINGNETDDNELDPGHTHTVRGELVMITSSNLTSGNTIENNVFLSASTNSQAAFVDSGSSKGHNTFLSNILESVVTNGPIYDWVGTIGSTLSQWQSLSGGTTDEFTGVTVTNPSGITANYVFPGGLSEPINGVATSLYGWSATSGLLGPPPTA